VVRVLTLIASLNVTVTTVLVATFVALLAGVTLVTVGGIVSTVVKDQVKFVARALPTTSFTPLLPPTTVAVYFVLPTRVLAGSSVAVRVAAL
jgi:hypothetical protein